MPPQIFRLVLLTFAIVVSYLVARTLMTPSSFREYGFYRGAVLVEHAGHQPVFAGKEACGERHPEILKKLVAGSHKTLGCESCHGVVSQDHLDDPDSKMVKPTDATCLRCHEFNPSRPAWFLQIDPLDHYAADEEDEEDEEGAKGGCLECHLAHEPNEYEEDE